LRLLFDNIKLTWIRKIFCRESSTGKWFG